MTNSNIKVTGISQEKLMQLLQDAGISTDEVKIEEKKPKIVDKLSYEDEQAVDSLGHKFDINALTEEEQNECKKSGLCPDCLHTLKLASEIKQTSGYRTRKFTNNQPSEEKAGYQIRELVKQYINEIDDTTIANLTNKEYCKRFKLQYALLLDITDKSSEEIKEMRKVRNHMRYSPQIYYRNNQQFLVTNDLYDKNLPLLKAFFTQQNE